MNRHKLQEILDDVKELELLASDIEIKIEFELNRLDKKEDAKKLDLARMNAIMEAKP